jgi:hypothetical protein
VKVPGELGTPPECPFHTDLWSAVRVEHQAKGQATIGAQGNGMRLWDEDWKGF